MTVPLLRCAGCGTTVTFDGDGPLGGPWACPWRDSGDDIDHVLAPVPSNEGLLLPRSGSDSPFVRYRHLLASYRRCRASGGSDDDFVRLVSSLDDAIGVVDGRGFRITPLVHASGLGAPVWVKDETGNVSGSHKGRHLMGLMLHLLVSGASPATPLAIASCGNAALAAAVMARAAKRELQVYVPLGSASPVVVDRLRSLGAVVMECPRVAGQTGDPSYSRFRQAVADGAVPFSCQGPDNGLTVDGGATLGWELAAQLADAAVQPDRVVVQVGGGALATAVLRGLHDAVDLGVLDRMPVLHVVQTEGAWPLVRAYEQVAKRIAGGEPAGDALAHAGTHRSQYMWPWETEPVSAAGGILDDETYDWLAVVRGLVETGGSPVVVGEAALKAANGLAREATGIDVDHTGSAGFAGLLELTRRGVVPPDDQVVVFFTG
ncbi:MAG TPA: pyridoxal-phosphate dependent enzyme [Acidimicrobiales bacterium]|nr:pyridoxal-phosphate dependent enzyme [Acidimicrobiales bacterium]